MENITNTTSSSPQLTSVNQEEPAVNSIKLTKPKKSLLIPILITLLFVTIGIAGYLYSQLNQDNLSTPNSSTLITTIPTTSPNPTANWKTYTNDQYGFSFKYPPNYTKTENYIDSNKSRYYISIISPLTNHPPKETTVNDQELKVEIYIQKSPAGDSIEAFIPSNIVENSSNYHIEEIMVGNVHAKYLEWEGVRSGNGIYFISDRYRFKIYKSPRTTNKDEEFTQILSTFKFTN